MADPLLALLQSAQAARNGAASALEQERAATAESTAAGVAAAEAAVPSKILAKDQELLAQEKLTKFLATSRTEEQLARLTQDFTARTDAMFEQRARIEAGDKIKFLDNPLGNIAHLFARTDMVDNYNLNATLASEDQKRIAELKGINDQAKSIIENAKIGITAETHAAELDGIQKQLEQTKAAARVLTAKTDAEAFKKVADMDSASLQNYTAMQHLAIARNQEARQSELFQFQKAEKETKENQDKLAMLGAYVLGQDASSASIQAMAKGDGGDKELRMSWMRMGERARKQLGNIDPNSPEGQEKLAQIKLAPLGNNVLDSVNILSSNSFLAQSPAHLKAAEILRADIGKTLGNLAGGDGTKVTPQFVKANEGSVTASIVGDYGKALKTDTHSKVIYALPDWEVLSSNKALADSPLVANLKALRLTSIRGSDMERVVTQALGDGIDPAKIAQDLHNIGAVTAAFNNSTYRPTTFGLPAQTGVTIKIGSQTVNSSDVNQVQRALLLAKQSFAFKVMSSPFIPRFGD